MFVVDVFVTLFERTGTPNLNAPTRSLASPMKIPLQSQNPTNWPRRVRYIDSTYYHASVLPAIKQQMQALPSTATSSNSKRPKVVIRLISNQSHPTYGQLGLFAGQRIAAKSQIIDYIGKISMNTPINCFRLLTNY